MTMKQSLTRAHSLAANTIARAVVGTMLLASGAAFGQSGEFTDRVKNARATSTTNLREGAQRTANDFGFIVGIGGMVVGLFLLVWGVIWIMSAARSEGRKDATAGWVMAIGGGVLGAATTIYVFIVGVFNAVGT